MNKTPIKDTKGKVKITKRQEDRIKEIKEIFSHEYALLTFAEGTGFQGILTGFTKGEFALLLCDWYEVVEE